MFAHYNAAVNHTFNYSTWEGREFSRTNTVSESMGVSVGVAAGPFSASTSYSGVHSQQTTRTWQAGRNTTHSMSLKRGQTAVVWQYELAAKCFNEVDMFMEELTFGTNIFHGTLGSRPTCDPNKPGDCR